MPGFGSPGWRPGRAGDVTAEQPQSGGFVDSSVGGRVQAVAMAHRLSIGDFSRMTFLTVKALRHYHHTIEICWPVTR